MSLGTCERSEKKCSACGVVQPLSEFYKHKGCADGTVNQCKKCCIQKTNAYRKTEAGKRALAKSWQQEPYKLRQREFQKSEAGALARQKAAKKHMATNPKKYQANYYFGNAIKLGWVKREPCFICGDPKAEGHHADYDNPLGVTWLCRKHHLETHALGRKLKAQEKHEPNSL